MALYLPSVFGRVGTRGKPSRAGAIYKDFVSRYQDNNAYPEDDLRTLPYTEKLKKRTYRLTGIKKNYQLRVVLFTQATKQDPERDPSQQDEAAERIIQKGQRKYDRAKRKGLLQ